MNFAQIAIARGYGQGAIPIAPPSMLTERSALKLDPLMPRVPDNVLSAVAFLYPRREEAETHARMGGTAFMVAYPVIIDGEMTPYRIPYMVTCRHVAWGSPVLRINRRDGNPPDIVDLDCDDWIVHPQGADVAVTCMLGKFDTAIHDLKHLMIDKLFSQQEAERLRIGVGDEVFMIGRFVNHQGRTNNLAAVRFGNVSMAPSPIHNTGIGKDQISYGVEMRSRTGFSGSPVCVWRNMFTILDDDLLPDVERRHFFGLLGINWGYIKDEDGENTWLNGVVPSWQILETLEVPALAKSRKEIIEDLKTALSEQPNDVAEPAAARLPSNGANPTHRADFNSLLGEAARKRPQGDQT